MEQESQGQGSSPQVPGSVPDIIAVIESAKARGGVESMHKYLHKRFPDSKQAAVEDAADVAIEIIESVPVFLARARQEAEERNLTSVIFPLLDHAERYYLQPVDLIPEMTQGLPGLLDDSYLVLRILENLEKGPERFLDWDFDYPRKFLSSLMGAGITRRLDVIAIDAMQAVSAELSSFWAIMSHEA